MKGEIRCWGSNSISVSGHHNIQYSKGGRCLLYMKSQVEGAGGGVDNLLISMMVTCSACTNLQLINVMFMLCAMVSLFGRTILYMYGSKRYVSCDFVE
jgi:hypothetical protein